MPFQTKHPQPAVKQENASEDKIERKKNFLDPFEMMEGQARALGVEPPAQRSNKEEEEQEEIQKKEASPKDTEQTESNRSGSFIDPVAMMNAQASVFGITLPPVQRLEDEEEIQKKKSEEQNTEIQPNLGMENALDPMAMMEGQARALGITPAPVQRLVEEEEEIQRKKNTGNSSGPASTSTKTNMPEDVQTKMEGSFGTDFSDVNIHKNDSSATDMGAHAYTQGNNVHFAPGQYNPSSTKGQELIGHELTHVVQQRQGRVQAMAAKLGWGTSNQAATGNTGMAINDSPSLEQEADVMGAKAARGERLQLDDKRERRQGEVKVDSKLSAQQSSIVQRDENGNNQDDFYVTKVSGVNLFNSPLDYNNKKIEPDKLPIGTVLKVIDTAEPNGDENSFNNTEDRYKWWYVKVISLSGGELSGKEGWVMQGLLTNNHNELLDQLDEEGNIGHNYIVYVNGAYFVGNPDDYENTLLGYLTSGTRVVLENTGNTISFGNSNDTYQWWEVTIAESDHKELRGIRGWVLKESLKDYYKDIVCKFFRGLEYDIPYEQYYSETGEEGQVNQENNEVQILFDGDGDQYKEFLLTVEVSNENDTTYSYIRFVHTLTGKSFGSYAMEMENSVDINSSILALSIVPSLQGEDFVKISFSHTLSETSNSGNEIQFLIYPPILRTTEVSYGVEAKGNKETCGFNLQVPIGEHFNPTVVGEDELLKNTNPFEETNITVTIYKIKRLLEHQEEMIKNDAEGDFYAISDKIHELIEVLRNAGIIFDLFELLDEITQTSEPKDLAQNLQDFVSRSKISISPEQSDYYWGQRVNFSLIMDYLPPQIKPVKTVWFSGSYIEDNNEGDEVEDDIKNMHIGSNGNNDYAEILSVSGASSVDLNDYFWQVLGEKRRSMPENALSMNSKFVFFARHTYNESDTEKNAWFFTRIFSFDDISSSANMPHYAQLNQIEPLKLTGPEFLPRNASGKFSLVDSWWTPYYFREFYSKWRILKIDNQNEEVASEKHFSSLEHVQAIDETGFYTVKVDIYGTHEAYKDEDDYQHLASSETNVEVISSDEYFHRLEENPYLPGYPSLQELNESISNSIEAINEKIDLNDENKHYWENKKETQEKRQDALDKASKIDDGTDEGIDKRSPLPEQEPTEEPTGNVSYAVPIEAVFFTESGDSQPLTVYLFIDYIKSEDCWIVKIVDITGSDVYIVKKEGVINYAYDMTPEREFSCRMEYVVEQIFGEWKDDNPYPIGGTVVYRLNRPWISSNYGSFSTTNTGKIVWDWINGIIDIGGFIVTGLLLLIPEPTGLTKGLAIALAALSFARSAYSIYDRISHGGEVLSTENVLDAISLLVTFTGLAGSKLSQYGLKKVKPLVYRVGNWIVLGGDIAEGVVTTIYASGDLINSINLINADPTLDESEKFGDIFQVISSFIQQELLIIVNIADTLQDFNPGDLIPGTKKLNENLKLDVATRLDIEYELKTKNLFGDNRDISEIGDADLLNLWKTENKVDIINEGAPYDIKLIGSNVSLNGIVELSPNDILLMEGGDLKNLLDASSRINNSGNNEIKFNSEYTEVEIKDQTIDISEFVKLSDDEINAILGINTSRVMNSGDLPAEGNNNTAGQTIACNQDNSNNNNSDQNSFNNNTPDTSINNNYQDILEELKTKVKDLSEDEWKLFSDDFANEEDLAKFDENLGLVEAWRMAAKHADLRTNTTVLSKLNDIAGSDRGIDKTKLKAALDGDLGDVLSKATGEDLTNILNRMDADKFTGTHLDEITSRLGNNNYGIKKDLEDHPEWFGTFDDMLQNPGGYWERISQGELVNGSALQSWAHGKWWKDLRETAQTFQNTTGLNKVKSVFGDNYGSQITLKITKGDETFEIVVDYLAQKDGVFYIIDTKYTTLDNFDLTKSFTPNQSKVFPWMKNDGDNITIVVRATNSKVQRLNLEQGDELDPGKLKIDIYKSVPGNSSQVASVINYK